MVKRNTPFEPRNSNFIEQFFHQGRLFFTEEELQPIREYAEKKPVISIVNLERGAILTDLDALSKGLLVEFGALEEVLAELLFGVESPKGKLPLELPRSVEAIEKTIRRLALRFRKPFVSFWTLDFDMETQQKNKTILD